jgi:hypothetical protein
MICHDTKGDLIAEFYDEENWILLNPFDERGYGFNIFEAFELRTDIKRICRALAPENEKGEPIWPNSTVDILTGIINLCYERGEFTNQDISKYIKMDHETLAKQFRTVVMKNGKPLVDANGKLVLEVIEGCSDAYNHLVSSQAGNLYSNFNSNMSFFKDMVSCKRELNIKKYFREDKRNLFLPNFDKLQASLSPIHTLFIEQLTSMILETPPHRERNIFFFLDEFASFKKIDAVLRLLRLVRSVGVGMWLGIQEFAPLKVKYGEEIATFKQNTSTKIFLSTKDDETQKQIVAMLGEEEREITNSSNSAGLEENKDGISNSTQRIRQTAIMGSYLNSLKRGDFYLMHNLVDTPNNKNFVAKIEGGIIEEIDINEIIAEAFVVREELKLTKLIDHFKRIEEKTRFDLENKKRVLEGLEELVWIETKNDKKSELDIINGIEVIEEKKTLSKEQLEKIEKHKENLRNKKLELEGILEKNKENSKETMKDKNSSYNNEEVEFDYEEHYNSLRDEEDEGAFDITKLESVNTESPYK